MSASAYARGLLVLLALASLGSLTSAATLKSVWHGIVNNPEFSVLKSVLHVTKLDKPLRDPNFVGTVFAPNDKAFVAYLRKASLTAYQLRNDPALGRKIVLTHILPDYLKAADIVAKNGASFKSLQGTKLKVEVSGKKVSLKAYASRATVVATDLDAPKAIVHVVDEVLVPKILNYKRCRTAYDIIARSKRNTVLKAAIEAGGYAAQLGKDFGGTVFAPTDAAFAALLKQLKTTLPALAGDTKTLTTVLLYHVLATPAFASDITQGLKVDTLAKIPLTFDIKSGRVLIKGVGSTAVVVRPDIFTCKGVVHIIDTVLLPTK